MQRGFLTWVAGVGLAGLLVALLGAGIVAYQYLKPTAAASAPIQAIDVAPAATTGTDTTIIFEIDQATSQASYTIDEVLRGSPFTVVGKTNQVAGQVAIDLSQADQTLLGPIQINARTLATDSQQRDRAVQNQVLKTDEHEYITFTPTALRGLPKTLAIGETATFQVVGDLTIRDVTRPATFDVTLTPLAADQLTGSATATIAFADWGITIPSVPSVTGVSEQVRLALDFTAVAA